MPAKTTDNCVVVRKCPNYDRERIQAIVTETMAELNYQPSGNIFAKPNVVFSSKNGKYGKAAYTDTAVVGGTLLALAQTEGVSRVDLGENTAIGYPTRLTYKYAGYYEELKHLKKNANARIRMFCIDEEPRDRVFIGGAVHDNLRIARKMARADSKVYLPKLKCHCVSTMTGAVKLNIGICSDDERALRHDFMLNEKIVDLLSVGYPDFIVMDAIQVGVGNEAFPTPRQLGLLIMGRNPLAVDAVGARLLGYDIEDVPYLKIAVDRGFAPQDVSEVELIGDIHSFEELDNYARKHLPHDDEFTRWQDINKELNRLESPIRFHWGYTKTSDRSKCKTGCLMGAKMFFGFLEKYAGPEAFKQGRAAVMVIGKVDEPIDANGHEAFLIGSCSSATITNAKKITRIDNCFTTAVDLAQTIRGRLGIPSPIMDATQVGPLLYNMLAASIRKLFSLRYFQDMGHFLKRGFQKRI